MGYFKGGNNMKNLYIDFDGVILDTITPVYNLAKSPIIKMQQLSEI